MPSHINPVNQDMNILSIYLACGLCKLYRDGAAPIANSATRQSEGNTLVRRNHVSLRGRVAIAIPLRGRDRGCYSQHGRIGCDQRRITACNAGYAADGFTRAQFWREVDVVRIV